MDGIRFSRSLIVLFSAILLIPTISFAQGACTFTAECKPKIEKTVVPYNKQANKFFKKRKKAESKYLKLDQKDEDIDEHWQAKLATIGVNIVAATIDCGIGVQAACAAIAKLVKAEAKALLKWQKQADINEHKKNQAENKLNNATEDLDCACNTLASVYALCPSNIPAASACPEL